MKNISFFVIREMSIFLISVNCERTFLFSVKHDLDPSPPLPPSIILVAIKITSVIFVLELGPC